MASDGRTEGGSDAKESRKQTGQPAPPAQTINEGKERKMYENPWRIDEIARMNRARIRDEMRQIRLEEQAERARSKQPAWLPQLWMAVANEVELIKSVIAFARRPTRFHVKRHARI
jgi:hypothetical protein